MRHVKRIGNLFWYGGFGLLILAAVLLSVARLLMPQLQEYHHELERRVGERLGVEVTIGEVDARLVGITPTLILRQLRLREAGGREASIGEVGLGLDGLRSLLAWSPLLKRLSVDGARLTLERDARGGLHLHGIGPLSRGGSGGTPGGALAALYTQGGLRLRDGQLLWIDHQRDERLEFSDLAMQLGSEGERHRLRAGLRLPESLGRTLNLAMELRGRLERPESWHGDIYLKGEGLRPGPWLPPLAGVSMEGGELELELWSRWDDGYPQELDGHIAAHDLRLRGSGESWRGERVETRLHGYFGNGGWRLDLAGLLLESGAEPSNLSIENSGDYWRLQADRLSLGPLSSLAALSDALPEAKRRQLAAMGPHGSILGLRLEYDVEQGPRAQAMVHDLGWASHDGLPGVGGLDATIRLDRGGADLHINSHDAALSLPNLFRSPLEADTLLGVVYLRRAVDGSGWHLHGRGLELDNADIQAQLALDLSLPEGAPPYLDLRGRFHDGDAAAAPRYLPAGLLKKPTLEWLDAAFKGGRLVSGGLLYHGRLKRGEFPFNEHQGRFEVRFDARDITLNYREEWPPLRAVNGEVLFNGPGMRIQGSARLYDSPVEEVEVRIDDLTRPLLQVHGHATPHGDDASRLLRESPLSRILGKAVASMQLQGDSRLQLDLKIPLSQQMAEELPLKVDGVLELADNRLAVREGIILEGVSGSLGFSEKALKVEELQARLFDGPVRIAGFTDEQDGVRHTRIVARGEARGERLGEALDYPFVDSLSGEGGWQALIDIAHGGQGTSLRIDSDLVGMAVKLPQPLGKAAAEEGSAMELKIQLSGERAGLVELNYGERLHALFEPREGGGLKRAALHFGSGRAELPEGQVMSLGGSLERVDLRGWRGALAGLGDGHGDGAGALPLQVSLRKLWLSELESEGSGPEMRAVDVESASLPPLSISVEKLRYGDASLGSLSLVLLPRDEGGVRLEELTLRHPFFEADAEGEWDSQADQSGLRLRMKSEDVGAATKALGFASVVSEGRAELNGKLRWPGAPQDISMERVAGVINVHVSDGRIEDIDPGAGKLLGLLSLQALPRRLILDFSDLFSKGMPFERISGRLNIEQGNVYTQDLRMESLSADVLVTGRSGLLARDFDQLVMVVPKVSGTLPVAAGLALGPQAGAVLLLLKGLIGEDIDRSAMVSYSVKGSWEKPRIEQLQVEQPKAEDELPE